MSIPEQDASRPLAERPAALISKCEVEVPSEQVRGRWYLGLAEYLLAHAAEHHVSITAPTPESVEARPLPKEPSEAAIEAAALVRWTRSEEEYATVVWDDAPAFVRKAYLETALLQLRAAYAVDQGAAEPGPVPEQWRHAVAWAIQDGECKACGAEVCRGIAHDKGCPFHG